MAKKELSDLGAEQAVLAGLCTYGLDAHVEVSDFLTVNSFSNSNNQIIFKCLDKVIQSGSSVDLPSILSVGEQLGFEAFFKDRIEYVNDILKYPVKRDNVARFAAQVSKFEFARRIRNISTAIGQEIQEIDGSESIDTIFGILENPVMEFLNQDNGLQKPKLIGEGIDDYFEYLLANRCDQIGLSSGFSRWDAAIGGGPRRGGVQLVAARPKTGKSVFADNVAVHVGKPSDKPIHVLMLDTEMKEKDHIHRIAANLGDIKIKIIETGQFGDNEADKLAVRAAFNKIKELKYTYASVAGMAFPAILNTIKRWIIQTVGVDENGKTNDCLVIYDYLKLMTSDSITANIGEFQALGFQISDLHNLAVRYDFPCLAFVQLNREGITKESSDAIAQSDRLVWLCKSFSIFKKKSPEEFAEDGPLAGNRKLIAVDCRDGPGMEDGNYINMGMTGDKSQLIELRTRDEFKVLNQTRGAVEGAEIPIEIEAPAEREEYDIPFELDFNENEDREDDDSES